jgi:hypothetical protein
MTRPRAAAQWERLPWATRTALDGECIDHIRVIDLGHPARCLPEYFGDFGEVLVVTLAQTDWLAADSDEITFTREDAPQVLVGGYRLAVESAGRLARDLLAAVQAVEQTTPTSHTTGGEQS